jgi:hypothetical protein
MLKYALTTFVALATLHGAQGLLDSNASLKISELNEKSTIKVDSDKIKRALVKTSKSSKSCKDVATDELVGSLAVGYAKIIKPEIISYDPEVVFVKRITKREFSLMPDDIEEIVSVYSIGKNGLNQDMGIIADFNVMKNENGCIKVLLYKTFYLAEQAPKAEERKEEIKPLPAENNSTAEEEGFLDKIKKSIKSDIEEVSSMLNRK